VPRHYELSPGSRPHPPCDPGALVIRLIHCILLSVQLRGDATCLAIIVLLDVVAPSRYTYE